ncbi:MAG: hypothetical protein KDB10_22475, partial [Acidimicrobiales bacterium]|nr:hypothetical protein [Acidimicrobiales bacterium]
KVMNLVSLLVLPAIISLDDNTGASLAIAAVSLVVLLVAIGYSKRDTGGLDADVAGASPVEDEAAPTPA